MGIAVVRMGIVGVRRVIVRIRGARWSLGGVVVWGRLWRRIEGWKG